MNAPAHQGQAGRARDASPLPFDLRVQNGRASLKLTRPLRTSSVDVRVLELDLPGLRFPLALSGGARRFRHRQTRVLSGELRFELPLLSKLAAMRGVTLALSHEASSATHLWVEAQDELGELFVQVRLLSGAQDVEFAVEFASSFAAEGYASYRRVHDLARRLGFVFDESRGVYKHAGALRALLRETLVVHGWRLPDLSGVVSAWHIAKHGTLILSLGRDEQALDASDVADAERYRRRAAHLRSVFELPSSSERLHEADVAFEAELAFERGEPLRVPESDGLRSHVLALRNAYTASDLKRAELARRVAELSPVAGLAAAALHSAASAMHADNAALALELTMRASALRPSQAAYALAAIELASTLGRADAITEISARASVALAGASDRGAFLRTLVAALLRMGDLDGAYALMDDLVRSDANDLASLALSAEIRLAAGDAAHAHSTYMRLLSAAEERLDLGLMRAAYLGLASSLVDLNDSSNALARLEDAAARFAQDGEIISALALCAVRVNEPRKAARAFSRLLTLPLDPRLGDALADAAEFHVERGEMSSARAFVDALSRADASSTRLPLLRARVMRATARRSMIDTQGLRSLDTHALEELASMPEHAAEFVATLLSLLDETSDAEHVATLVRVARVAAEHDETGRLRARVAERASQSALLLNDVTMLEALESHAQDPDSRRRLAQRIAELHKAAGDWGAAAQAMARAALLEGDAARLRGAVDLAEAHEAWTDAHAIVLQVLRTLDDGPAKRAWLERLRKLESLRTEHG